ncbi:MAG: potassium channel protein [Zetaproteobacteria bacterium]|nr:MAG: potassium channel protein [Zetaproteobacteria bacterium]
MEKHVPKELSGLRGWLNRRLFDLHTPEGQRTNRFIMLAIVLSVFISMFGTVPDLAVRWQRAITAFEYLVSVLFALEYAARLYAAEHPRKYALSFYGLVDLMTFLPMFIFGDPGLAVRLLRVLRLLKLVRYLKALQLFIHSLRDVFDIMLVVAAAIFLVVLIGGNLAYFLEGEGMLDPPTFRNAFEGAWWALVTMTTVGYGDIVPHTPAGKVLAAALMMLGLTMFAMLTGTISVKIAHALSYHRACRKCERLISQEFVYCPFCGADQREEEDKED